MPVDTQDTRKSRDEAREILTDKVASMRHAIETNQFSTIPPQALIDDAEHRLRWIDCAPEGARHCVAPLQDKAGVPMGTTWREGPTNAPGKALRQARIARGLHPFDPSSTLATVHGPATVRGFRCEDCDATFLDGINAGNHEIDFRHHVAHANLPMTGEGA